MKLAESKLNKEETKAVKYIATGTDLNSDTPSVTLLYALDTFTNINTKKVNTTFVRLILKQIERGF